MDLVEAGRRDYHARRQLEHALEGCGGLVGDGLAVHDGRGAQLAGGAFLRSGGDDHAGEPERLARDGGVERGGAARWCRKRNARGGVADAAREQDLWPGRYGVDAKCPGRIGEGGEARAFDGDEDTRNGLVGGGVRDPARERGALRARRRRGERGGGQCDQSSPDGEGHGVGPHVMPSHRLRKLPPRAEGSLRPGTSLDA